MPSGATVKYFTLMANKWMLPSLMCNGTHFGFFNKLFNGEHLNIRFGVALSSTVVTQLNAARDGSLAFNERLNTQIVLRLLNVAMIEKM